jgi:hypothetical protein
VGGRGEKKRKKGKRSGKKKKEKKVVQEFWDEKEDVFIPLHLYFAFILFPAR